MTRESDFDSLFEIGILYFAVKKISSLSNCISELLRVYSWNFWLKSLFPCLVMKWNHIFLMDLHPFLCILLSLHVDYTSLVWYHILYNHCLLLFAIMRHNLARSTALFFWFSQNLVSDRQIPCLHILSKLVFTAANGSYVELAFPSDFWCYYICGIRRLQTAEYWV